jgi:phosphorylase kinase alpha/beta subunit
MNPVEKHLDNLQRLKTPQDLWIAAEHFDPNNRYDYVWVRDVVQTIPAYLHRKDFGTVAKAADALLRLVKRHEDRLDSRDDPNNAYCRFPIKYTWQDLARVDPWNHLQNDALGALLWLPGECARAGLDILDAPWKRTLLGKIVEYLKFIEYWRSADAGYWEENNEIRASSVGICVAGLREAAGLGVSVEPALIEFGRNTLRQLLPNETVSRAYDAATLSLIWPYKVVEPAMAKIIVERTADKLLRRQGVARYPGDRYHGSPGAECEWSFLFVQLGICSAVTRHDGLLRSAIDYSRDCLAKFDNLPEGFYAGSSVANPNRNLAWAASWATVAELMAA